MAQFKQKISAAKSMLYLHNLPLAVFGVVGVASTGNPALWRVVEIVLFSWLLMVAGSVINVFSDWENDRANKKNLGVHSAMRKSTVKKIYFLLVAIVLSLSLLENAAFFIICALAVLNGLAYSLGPRLKDRYILNYLSLSACFGILLPLAGIALVSQSVTEIQIVSMLFLTLFVFFSSQIKDFEDVQGDKTGSTLAFKRRGKQTYAAYHAIFFAVLLGFIAAGLLPIKFLIVFLTVPAFIIFLYKFIKVKNPLQYRLFHWADNALAFLIVVLFVAAFLL